MVEIGPACCLCLERLVYWASQLATEDPSLRAQARVKALGVLAQGISTESVSTVIASEANRIICDVTSNRDAYARMKRREIEIASASAAAMCDASGGLESSVHTAVRGNAIDFVIGPDVIAKGLTTPISLAIDEFAELEKLIGGAPRALIRRNSASADINRIW